MTTAYDTLAATLARARSLGTPPAVLAMLASDADADVRAAVAQRHAVGAP